MVRLIFDFPDAESGRSARTVYRDPVQVVTAERMSEVRPALVEVERMVAGGMHAAGYVAYEAAPAFEPRMRVRSGGRMPPVWFGIFRGPSDAGWTEAEEGEVGPARGSARGSALDEADWTLDMDRSRYDAAVAEVRDAIAEGRTYQVNLTARLRAELDAADAADPRRLYESLRRAQGAGWHALLEMGPVAVVSVSPELFFRTRDGRIETRPMKGTRRRGRWSEEDAALAAELAASEKDRAENLMIVDLLRNDLGRICRTGSVTVPRLYDVERYRTVWQMTSGVEGQLREGVGLEEILAALFPCGSVTGAPKISTMSLITDLETSPREVYCGAIGLVRPLGDMTFSVPIRTLWLEPATRRAEYGTGGGIVWDSVADAEHDELLAKAVVVMEPWPEFELLETMAVRGGRIPRLERHLDRLRRSADYFEFAFPEDAIRTALDQTLDRTTGSGVASGAGSVWRVRLTLSPDGKVRVDEAPLDGPGANGPRDRPGSDPSVAEPTPHRIAVAERPIETRDRFLYHKTTHRRAYDQARAAHPKAFDVLLWNERGEATEFTRGNLVVERDGALVTPPLAAGLLPGCLRGELLEAGLVREETVRLEEVAAGGRLWFINSAREWVEVVVED